MAAALPLLLFCLHTFTGSALGSASEQDPSKKHPQLTGCVSANMDTFHCRWNVGSFQGLSEPGDLRLFYINKKSPHDPPEEWTECPHYSTGTPNECFFNENHTSVWTYYRVQLRSKDNTTLYDENGFYVEDIVQPDPPISLNWTLLNVSLTGINYDIILRWNPPLSADVGTGWMRLLYEIQYRDMSSDLWKAIGPMKSTYHSLYGLQTNVNHEIRVRCKMFGGNQFGEFSDSVFIHIPFKVEVKDAEIKKLLEKKDMDLEEMKKRLKEQERERQSELLKLQMEFGAKLARVQSTAQWSQQQQHQQHGSNLLPQSVFKKKLQSFQEEKNKEIVALRQRIKELEENQRACGLNDMRLKRKKI